METTDYASYDLALKLKACGFDEPCAAFYECINGKMYFSVNGDEDWNSGVDYSAPHIYHAQKWLREKWLLHIGANPAIPTRRWQFYIDDLNQQINPHNGELMTRWDDDMQGKADERLYDSYEAALSAGIYAALELIKKGE